LRQALDTVGAIAGPLLAVVLIGYFAGNFRAAFWVAVIPAALCMALLVFGVHEKDEPAKAASAPGVLAGAALWGLHMALTQGLLAALVAATAPDDLRGTAFGVFNLASGIALLVASTLAGFLWQTIGPAATFLAGAAFTAIAWAALAWHARAVPRLDGGR
jgi:MFS family permease